MPEYEFLVISWVPNPEEGGDGNLYNGWIAWEKQSDGTYKRTLPGFGGTFFRENFTVGEVLIVDKAHGREITGLGRKPSKWHVEYVVFDNIKDAVEKALELGVAK